MYIIHVYYIYVIYLIKRCLKFCYISILTNLLRKYSSINSSPRRLISAQVS